MEEREAEVNNMYKNKKTHSQALTELNRACRVALIEWEKTKDPEFFKEEYHKGHPLNKCIKNPATAEYGIIEMNEKAVMDSSFTFNKEYAIHDLAWEKYRAINDPALTEYKKSVALAQKIYTGRLDLIYY